MSAHEDNEQAQRHVDSLESPVVSMRGINCVCGHGDDGRHDVLKSEMVGTIITCPDVPPGELWGIDARYLTRPKAPRVLARITEEAYPTYRSRCETCAPSVREWFVWATLSLAAHDAEQHAVTTGHAVLVEAL